MPKITKKPRTIKLTLNTPITDEEFDQITRKLHNFLITNTTFKNFNISGE